MSAGKAFEVIVEKVYEIHADSIEEAQAIAADRGFERYYGCCVQSDVVSVNEVHQ